MQDILHFEHTCTRQAGQKARFCLLILHFEAVLQGMKREMAGRVIRRAEDEQGDKAGRRAA
jgi:hypothetical protein